MKEMSFMDHLEELRTTLIRICIILAITFTLTMFYVDQLTEFMLVPLRAALTAAGSGVIVYHSVFEKAMVQIDVSIWASIILASPFWFWEFWKFVRPALHQHEIRMVRPFFIVGLVLFLLGVVFGYMVVFPVGFKFLMTLGVTGVEANINLRDYVSLSWKILLMLGVLFQFPNVLLILGFMGVVTKQFLRKIRRYVYVGLAVAAAIFSPPDVFSMLAIWIPTCILYEVGVLAVAWIVHPYLAKVHSK